MNDDRYRRLVRSGLAPLVEDVPEGPDWEDLIADDTVVVAAPPPQGTRGWIVGLSVSAVVLVLVGLAVVLSPSAPPSTSEPADTSPPATSVLDAANAASELEAWWRLVLVGDTGGAVVMSHPDAEFNFPGVYESMLDLGENIEVSAEREVFGTDEQPMLCYTLTGTTGQQAGAGVFRQHQGDWLIWEIRPQTAGCLQESTSTTTTPSTTEVERPDPLVSPLPVNPEIPLKIVAIRPNNPSIAIVDLQSGQLTEYPPGTHALPADATDGAVVTSNRDVIIWTNGVARLFTGELGSVTRVLGPTPPRSLEGIAPALRVVPLDGQRAWLVQPGVTTESGVAATLVELIDLSSGDQLLFQELDEDAFPIASTGDGLLLNTDDLLRTDEGFITAPGSQRVMHLLDDGTVTDVGQGLAIAASSNTIAVLVCPANDANCELHETNELALTKLDSGEQIEVTKPAAAGAWRNVGGPMVPSDAMPLQTVSPDGSTLLVSLGLSLDVNGTPAESSLLAVDITDGNARILADFDGSTPLATWSADGEWVALIERVDADRIDIRLINFADPNQTILIEDAIPSGHFPFAAG